MATSASAFAAEGHAPIVAELRDEDARVLSVMERTHHHMVITCPTIHHRREYHADHRARAEQALDALSHLVHHADSVSVALIPPPPQNGIVSAFVALAKFAPPLIVAYYTFLDDEPLALLLSFQLFAFLLVLCRWLFFRVDKPSVLEPCSVISISMRDGLLRLHGKKVRTISLSAVRSFRAAVSTRNPFSKFYSLSILWVFFRMLVTISHDVEVVGLGEPLVLPGFKSAYIAESVADALNAVLHQVHASNATPAPPDVFDMTYDATNGKTTKVSPNTSLLSALPYRDRFAVYAGGMGKFRCNRRRSSLRLMACTSIMLCFLDMFVATNTIRFVARGKSVFTELHAVRILPWLLFFAVLTTCVGLFTFWWTQIFMRRIMRMESIEFVDDATPNRFWLTKWILAHCTGRFVVSVHGVTAMEVSRKPVSSTAVTYRSREEGDNYVVGARYGLRLLRSGRQAFRIENLYEDEVLYLAYYLRATYPQNFHSR